MYEAWPITDLSLGRFLFPPAHRESHLWCKSIIKANQYWIFSRDYTVLDMCGSLSNGIMGSMWADSLCVGQICCVDEMNKQGSNRLSSERFWMAPFERSRPSPVFPLQRESCSISARRSTGPINSPSELHSHSRTLQFIAIKWNASYYSGLSLSLLHYVEWRINGLCDQVLPL